MTAPVDRALAMQPSRGRLLGEEIAVPRWRWILAALASLLAGVVLLRTAPWQDISSAAQLAAGEPAAVLAVAIAYTAAFWLRAWAWRLLLTTPMAVGNLFAILQLGLLLNHVLPVKAGEVSRPLLAIKRGASAVEAATTTVVARILDLLCLAGIALTTLSWSQRWGAFDAVALAGIVCIGLGAALLIAVRQGAHVVPRSIEGRLEPARDGLLSIPLSRLALALPIVAGSWVLEGAVLFGAAYLLGVDLSLHAAVGVTAFTILFQVVHITPGGLGVYEAAMTSALVGQGVEPSTALGLAIVTHALKFGYAFTASPLLGGGEAISLLRGRREQKPRSASRFEVIAARLWNLVNEGKPFMPIFAATVVLILSIPDAASLDYWGRAAVAVIAVLPLAGVFWHFDFPMKLRGALWGYLAIFLAVTAFAPWGTIVLVVVLYLAFTVLLWGTVYYHLRIGTSWSNGLRFIRLVAENEDPTSGNLLEQLPKVLLLVLAFEWVVGAPSAASIGTVLLLTLGIGVSALLLHQWFFTWVPALPQPRDPGRSLIGSTAREGDRRERRAQRVIVIVIDGCRADRLLEAHTPFIDSLREAGTDYRAMNTVYPARTVTCFSSMLTGAAPSAHGMHSNFVPSLGVKCESVFDVLRREGMTGRLVGIAHLIDAFGDDVSSVTAVMHNDEIDDALVARAQRELLEHDPELLVLQLLSVDQTGHARGSYNEEYLRKIEETDKKIESFLAWCGERGYLDDATVIITADHGQGIGIGGHGHLGPTEVRIPCILWGAGVDARGVVEEPRFITDIASTISDCLGIPDPGAGVGRSLLTDEASCEADRPVVFVVPAYNEERNLPGVLDEIAASGVHGAEVLVVDDGSTDRTAEVARTGGALVVSHETNRGLGAAVRSGLAAARERNPRAVVYLDADGEYDAREAARLLAPIEAGEADYVLGSRFSTRPPGMPLSRRLANRAFSLLLSVCCGRWISDGQGGYRAFSPRALEVAEVIHDYNYAQVLTLDLLRKGMRMRQVGVSYRRRANGSSFVNARYLWRVPLGMLREMVRA